MTEPEKQIPEPTGKTKFLFDDYTSYAEWAARPPIAPSDRPIYLPREWVGHIAIAIASCLNRSEDGVDLEAMEKTAKRLLKLYPDLVDDVPSLRFMVRE